MVKRYEKKVTVIVPTYRQDVKLIRAIKSLVNQKHNNIEIIVISDNADENWNFKVKEIIKYFNDNRIILIVNNENLGSSISRNVGLEYATGDYITFLDDDDEYLPEKISSQLYKMIDDSSDYSITNIYLYKENKLFEKRIRNNIEKSIPNEIMKYHLLNHLTGTMTFMIKSQYIKSVNGFDLQDLGDEFYLMAKLIEANGKFSYYNECYVRAYLHKGNTGLSSGTKKIEGEKELLKFKLQYKHLMKKKDIRHIYARHFLVISYTNFRNKKFFRGFYYTIRSILTSPKSFAKLIYSR